MITLHHCRGVLAVTRAYFYGLETVNIVTRYQMYIDYININYQYFCIHSDLVVVLQK